MPTQSQKTFLPQAAILVVASLTEKIYLIQQVLMKTAVEVRGCSYFVSIHTVWH